MPRGKKMSDNRRWKTKEEAEEFVSNAIKNHNYGLSYCAACDFLGIDPSKDNESAKQFHLSLVADCMMSWSNEQLKDLISELKDEMLTAEYVDSHKCKDPDDDLASAKEIIEIAKQELRQRHGYERKQIRKRYRLHSSHR